MCGVKHLTWALYFPMLSQCTTVVADAVEDYLPASVSQVKAEEVAVMAPEEAIFLTMLALLSAGDHVICTFPGYQSLYEVSPCWARETGWH